MSGNRLKISFSKRKIDRIVEENTKEFDKDPLSFEIDKITQNTGKLTITSNTSKIFKEFDGFFDEFSTEIDKMSLPHKSADKIYELSEKLIKQIEITSISLASSRHHESELVDRVKENISDASQYMLHKFADNNTKFKRDRHREKNPLYVQPEEKAVGLKWRTKCHPETDLPDHKLVQPTFQHVPIGKTLRSLFQNGEFSRMYFDYNNNNKHKCVEGVYKNYCCGSNFQKHNLHDHPSSVHIQLGIDDVEVCCAMKSHATVHKITAIYFQMKNLPQEYASKLDYIFLVALCETENLKHKETSLDNILDVIVNELLVLETEGLNIDSQQNLKCFLINCCFDNLGGNGLFGFKESFACDYFCRCCTVSKRESEISIEVVRSKLRSKEVYDQIMQKLNKNENVEPKIAQGYRKYCLLNDLQHFHILDNFSFDIMHDVNEGIVPFFLERFFNHLVDKHKMTVKSITNRVRDFNYGILEKKNRPSKLAMQKHNLGQNASQSVCLMIALPFIFHDLRDDLDENVQEAMKSLLQLMQIIYSIELTELDVQRLEFAITNHLISFKRAFNLSLKPKHHHCLHYPDAIRASGPLVRSWMMRFEAKHQFCTNVAKKTKNFRNIAKTIADRHQNFICQRKNFDALDILPSKKTNIMSSVELEKFQRY